MEIITNIKESRYSPLFIACDINLNDDEMIGLIGDKKFEKLFGEPDVEDDYPLARIAITLFNNAMEADGESHWGDLFYSNIRATYSEEAKNTSTLDCYLEGADELSNRQGVMVNIYMSEGISYSKLKQYQDVIEDKLYSCLHIASMYVDSTEPVYVGIPCYNSYMTKLGAKFLRHKRYSHAVNENSFHISTMEDENFY